jgi:hypothetical protein
VSLRKRLLAASAVTALLASAVPLAAANAALPPLPGLPGSDNSQICLHGIVDPGPLGPMGPYGPLGPYGKNGPLNGQPNPIGNAATCGGALTFFLRGGNLTSFVNGNLASVGITGQ